MHIFIFYSYPMWTETAGTIFMNSTFMNIIDLIKYMISSTQY